jgi:uncharacterized protein (DUF58 family)
VSPLPSADRTRLQPVLLWAGVTLAVFLAFRLILPPKPAAAPLVACLGFMLVAAVLYSMRGRIFVRSAAFAFVGAAAYLFAWNRGVPLLYAFSAACFAIVVVSHLLPRWALRLVEGRIAAPAWISQGDAAELRIVASNPSPATVRMLELEVPLEGALAEPARARALLVQLAGGTTREISMRTPPLARGRRFAGPLRLRTGFPLGLAFAEAEVAGSGQHVWVYPRLFQIEYVPIAGEQFLEGDAISPRSGGVEEFAGVREYRRGDSRRHVHWRASARLGELVVKEFTRRTAATVTVALDLSQQSLCGTGIETTAEYAIRAAASVARYALEQGHYVQLALCGAKFELIGPLHGRGDLEEVLRVLALAQATGEQPFAAWLPRVLAAAPEDSTLVAVYTDAAARPAPVSAFNRRGVLIVPVVVDAASFAPPASRARVRGAAPRGRERRLRMGEDLEAVFRR